MPTTIAFLVGLATPVGAIASALLVLRWLRGQGRAVQLGRQRRNRRRRGHQARPT